MAIGIPHRYNYHRHRFLLLDGPNAAATAEAKSRGSRGSGSQRKSPTPRNCRAILGNAAVAAAAILHHTCVCVCVCVSLRVCASARRNTDSLTTLIYAMFEHGEHVPLELICYTLGRQLHVVVCTCNWIMRTRAPTTTNCFKFPIRHRNRICQLSGRCAFGSYIRRDVCAGRCPIRSTPSTISVFNPLWRAPLRLIACASAAGQ